MRALTVKAIRLLIEVGLDHADEINPATAQSLAYCLPRMKRYAHEDWAQIRDLQPLLLAVQRHARPTPPFLP